MALKLSMLIVFSLAMVAIGIWCRRSATDVSGFVLAGRAVGPWMTAFAYGTSYFSAVIFVGYAGQFGWKFGIASTWIGLANCFLGSLLAWIVLGRRTRLMTQKMKCATMPQFFGERFASPALKIAAAAIVFVFLIPYTASLYNGLSRLFRMAFGIDYTVCIIVMSVLTCAYVVLGGYMATAINDFVQGIIMLIGIVAVIAAVLHGQGGFTAALEKLSAVPAEVPGVFNSFFGPDPFSLFAVIILTSLGTWGLPQMVGKFYAIRDSRSIRTGTVVSTVFALIVAGGCYFLGGVGRLFDVNVANEGFDAVIPEMISTLPDFLIGVVVILVFAASMSTLSSLVLTSSSTLTLDLIKGFFVKKMHEKKQLLTMRLLVGVFVAISAAIAIFQYKSGGTVKFIAQMMGLSWGALAGSFLAPFLYGLWWKKTSKASVWVSFAFGCVNMCLNMFAPSIYPAWLQSPINCGAFTMLAGLVIVPIVSLLTPKPDQTKVGEIFDSLNRDETFAIPAAEEAAAEETVVKTEE